MPRQPHGRGLKVTKNALFVTLDRVVGSSKILVWQVIVNLQNLSQILVWQALVNLSNIGMAAAIPATLVPKALANAETLSNFEFCLFNVFPFDAFLWSIS